mgnify:CR=1 FL=1
MASRTRIDSGDNDMDEPGPDPFVRAADFISFSPSEQLGTLFAISTPTWVFYTLGIMFFL